MYIDRALPFGLRSAPKIFSAVADMLAWAIHQAGIPHLIHYLDDFLFMGAPDTQEGVRALDIALKLFAFLGIPVSVHKTEGPATCVAFLGILVDTRACQLRLPLDKLRLLQALIDSWCSKQACNQKELESLLEHLSHAVTVASTPGTYLSTPTLWPDADPELPCSTHCRGQG